MISKSRKSQALEFIKSKEEKILISNVIDKANKCEESYILTHTSFLDLHEISIATSILNKEKVKYHIYYPNEFCEKALIFFIPDYIEIEYMDFNEYVCCVKIDCKTYKALLHKDYMGSIYSLGLKHESIGDIFVSNGIGYVYTIESIGQFLKDNLLKVSNQTAICSILSLDLEETLALRIEYNEKMYIVPSYRADAILSEVYNISRAESKEKIVSGDLYINSRQYINPSENLSQGDIVALRRCGKFKVGQELKRTKSGNICVNIKKYK